MSKPRDKKNKNNEITQADLTTLKEWARTHHRPSAPCQTCTKYPHLRPIIRAYLEMRKSGVTDGSISSFRREVLVPKGYGLEVGSLRRHGAKCEGDLYGAISWR